MGNGKKTAHLRLASIKLCMTTGRQSFLRIYSQIVAEIEGRSITNVSEVLCQHFEA